MHRGRMVWRVERVNETSVLPVSALIWLHRVNWWAFYRRDQCHSSCSNAEQEIQLEFWDFKEIEKSKIEILYFLQDFSLKLFLEFSSFFFSKNERKEQKTVKQIRFWSFEKVEYYWNCEQKWFKDFCWEWKEGWEKRVSVSLKWNNR